MIEQNYISLFKPFFVWQEKQLRRIQPLNVVWLLAEGNYTKIYFTDQSHYIVRTTLSRTQKKLPPEMFIRIHRSFVVSIFYIDQIERDQLLVAGASIPIGKQYYKSLISKLDLLD